MAEMVAKAAVSVRKMRGPSRNACQPIARHCCSSAAENPPRAQPTTQFHWVAEQYRVGRAVPMARAKVLAGTIDRQFV